MYLNSGIKRIFISVTYVGKIYIIDGIIIASILEEVDNLKCVVQDEQYHSHFMLFFNHVLDRSHSVMVAFELWEMQYF